MASSPPWHVRSDQSVTPRAPPIIGYLPFEVLGTSGYDYYHADDLELLARCHEHLMQFGKGKSCYYRFLTKGQQWIWLQTHYYITYHQWNSKPEFIVCSHTVVSYAEVRAERRRDVGLEESSIELASSSLKSQRDYINTRHCVPANQEVSPTSSMRHTDASTPTRQSLSLGQPDTVSLRLASGGNSQGIITPSDHLVPHHMTQPAVPAQQTLMVCCPRCKTSVRYALQPRNAEMMAVVFFRNGAQLGLVFLQPGYHFPTQMGMMHQLKEQLEERTRILQADIKTQQEELHVIKEQLQLVQDSNLQMFMQQSMPVVFSTVQSQPSARRQPTGATLGTRPAAPKKSQQQQSIMGSKQFGRSQIKPVCMPIQMSISLPVYNNPMVFTQTHPLPVPSPMPPELGERPQPPDYNQEGNLRFTQEPQSLPSAIQMQPVTCAAIRAPIPSPGFTSSLMIPQPRVTVPQSHPAGTLHQWTPQPTATLGYFHHPQPPSHHLQGQPCSLQDLPEMQLP
ncbi:Circadian locomoter output cycles protein kaput, partial [Ophiophagus hannah]